MSIKTVILQFICPDKPGLVSDLASWIASKNGNIRHADHHTDADAKLFDLDQASYVEMLMEIQF